MKITVITRLVLLFSILLIVSCSNEPTEPEITSYNWQIATPQELGLNSTMLDVAVNQAFGKGFINSIIVIRHGKIAVEKYFNGKNANSYQTVRSVSKSFLSALVGIAVSKGMLELDQKMIDSFPGYMSAVTDTNVKHISLKHLITMRSGIKGDEEFYFTFTQSSNWIKTIISTPLNFQPGTRALYSTAGTHVVSGMLTKSFRFGTKAFAHMYLLGSMGIKTNDWSKDPQGNYFGGNDMFFTTRNMAVLGLLYLNNGILNGKQIVSQDWIENSLDYSGGSSIVWGRLTEGGYGYMWWLGKVAGQTVFFALGHGGQFIMCVPEHNLIVAVTSDPYVDWNVADAHERAVLEIIADHIIPAVDY